MLKRVRPGAEDCIVAEAHGLAALAATGTVLCVPVLRCAGREIVTRYIAPGHPDSPHWARLGQQLAALHERPAPGFGFSRHNYCGATPQPNPQTDDGFTFFADARLRYQARLAHDAGLLDTADLARVEHLCGQLENMLPAQAPALLHGDLWRGNVLFDGDGKAWLIDPAAHWGWPEADLAMTTLFGGFSDAFYAAYENCRPAVGGWRERCDIYNLYHLINHLNLFGNSYLGQVRAILRRYA